MSSNIHSYWNYAWSPTAAVVWLQIQEFNKNQPKVSCENQLACMGFMTKSIVCLFINCVSHIFCITRIDNKHILY
jgi:hypothetical protein